MCDAADDIGRPNRCTIGAHDQGVAVDSEVLQRLAGARSTGREFATPFPGRTTNTPLFLRQKWWRLDVPGCRHGVDILGKQLRNHAGDCEVRLST